MHPQVCLIEGGLKELVFSNQILIFSKTLDINCKISVFKPIGSDVFYKKGVDKILMKL